MMTERKNPSSCNSTTLKKENCLLSVKKVELFSEV
jgi:hypothetical protein